MIGGQLEPQDTTSAENHMTTPVRRRRPSKVDEIFGSSLKRARMEANHSYDLDDAVLEDEFMHLFTPLSSITERERNVDQCIVAQPTFTMTEGLLASAPSTPAVTSEAPDQLHSPNPSAQVIASTVLLDQPSQVAYLSSSDDDGETQPDSGLNEMLTPWDVPQPKDDAMFEKEINEETDVDDKDTYNLELKEYLNGRMGEDERLKLLAQAILSTRLTQADNDKLQTMPGAALEDDTFISEYRIRRELQKETGFEVKSVDCCWNGCMAFTGQYAEDHTCPLCKRLRWNTDHLGRKKPKQTFLYISPINRLRAIWRDKEACKQLGYRYTRTHDPDMIEDVFDAQHFQHLLQKNVTWEGREILPVRRYFQEKTELALGLGTDGIPLFKKSPVDCWPLVITNYSMPDYLRNHKENLICCGLIPGKKERRFANAENDKPTFLMDTFLQPLIDDLKILATQGVKAVRWDNEKLIEFKMKAHLILIIGDMPAISKITHFKGINSIAPCRCCHLHATATAGSKKKTYYPCISPTGANVQLKDYLELSLRDHAETIRSACWISECQNMQLRGTVQKDLGINDQALLSVVGSVSFPWSFPADIMHLLFENLMKASLSSWAGTYKLGKITEDRQVRLQDAFVIGDGSAKWKSMAREVAGSNTLVPSAIASRVQDLDARGWWTAETYSYFLLFLGPIVLKDRLPREHFLHFLRLSDISRTITKMEIVRAELPDLKKKIAQWVLDYERLYYQYEPSKLPFCTAPVHAMLHIADYITWQGPPCRYWTFALERTGGFLKRELNNNQLPIVALSNRIIKQEQIYILMSGLSAEGRAQIVKWETGHRRRPNWGEEDDRAVLFDKVARGYQLNDRVFRAIKSYLETCSYPTNHHYTGRRGNSISISLKDVMDIPMTVYASWRSRGEDGRQTFRTDQCKRSISKDASWCLYDQAYDLRERMRTGQATYRRIKKMQWGKILHFVEFEWKGAGSTSPVVNQLAVVQPWESTVWCNGISPSDFRDPPFRLVKEVTKLQAMDVRALRHVAGRVSIDGSDKWVIFETSLGLLIPEMI